MLKRDTEVRLPRATKVKNKQAADKQVLTLYQISSSFRTEIWSLITRLKLPYLNAGSLQLSPGSFQGDRVRSACKEEK